MDQRFDHHSCVGHGVTLISLNIFHFVWKKVQFIYLFPSYWTESTSHLPCTQLCYNGQATWDIWHPTRTSHSANMFLPSHSPAQLLGGGLPLPNLLCPPLHTDTLNNCHPCSGHCPLGRAGDHCSLLTKTPTHSGPRSEPRKPEASVPLGLALWHSTC